MKLSAGEHSILAYFPNSDAAQDAINALQNAGISETQMDRVSRYGVSLDRDINNPIAGGAVTLTGLTLFSTDTDRYSNSDTRVLMGADPSVSGMAAEGYGVPGGKAFLVTVVTNEENLGKAEQILKDKGAYF